MLERLVEEARRLGPIPAGNYRAVTLESGNQISSRDFDSLETACRYADDAASENDNGSPIAIVLDAEFAVVHKGRPYYLRGD